MAAWRQDGSATLSESGCGPDRGTVRSNVTIGALEAVRAGSGKGSPGSRRGVAEESRWDGPGRAPPRDGAERRLRPAGCRACVGRGELVKVRVAAAAPRAQPEGVGPREKPCRGVRVRHANGGRTPTRKEKGACEWRAHTDTKEKLGGVYTGGS